MRYIQLSMMIVLALPAETAGQAPQGLARRALADSSFTWITRRAPGLRVHFLAGSYAAEHQDSLMARVAAARAHDLALLGEERYDPTLQLFFLQDRPQMEHLLGMRATGFADMQNGSVFLMTNPDWRAFERHEVMHVLATQLWGRPAEPSAWIQEGLAQFADGACGGYPIDPVVVGLAGGRGYVPMDTLTTRFRRLDDLTAYLQAASFVGYIYRRYGRDVVRDAWRRGLDSAARALHRTPSELRGEWMGGLPTPGDGPPPGEIERIRSKGCG